MPRLISSEKSAPAGMLKMSLKTSASTIARVLGARELASGSHPMSICLIVVRKLEFCALL